MGKETNKTKEELKLTEQKQLSIQRYAGYAMIVLPVLTYLFTEWVLCTNRICDAPNVLLWIEGTIFFVAGIWLVTKKEAI